MQDHEAQTSGSAGPASPCSWDSPFETRRSPRQDLTFDVARALFEHAGAPLDQSCMLELGLQDVNGVYTNLGLLFSDQNPFEIRCAVYGEVGAAAIQSRRAFTGSLPGQIGDVLDHLASLGLTAGAYPPACLRAALLNCAAHRDYAYNGPVLVNLHPDRARFVSLGGLAGDLTVDDVLQGVSTSRNPRLAAALGRLGLFEGYGTGMQTIVAHYGPTGRSPQLEAATRSLVTELPNLAYEAPRQDPQPAAAPAPKPSATKPAPAKTPGKVLGAAPVGEKIGADRYDPALTQELLKHLARRPKKD